MNIEKFTPLHPLNTAVLFLVFNRLDTTKQVFEAIREAKPPRLYIAADGARESKEGEDKKVKEVREYIVSNIDWKCEVKTLFREQNYGCKTAISGAIDWFFENEEMGIIIEDDCLPSQSFFWFCETLLNRYKDDIRISMVAGTSYLFNEILSKEDYFFSKYISIWGWATWKRAWSKYDVEMSDWSEIMKNKLHNEMLYLDKPTKECFLEHFEKSFNKEYDVWGYQWVYRCLVENGYCITPYKNLISNLGIEGRSGDSTNSPFINMKNLEVNIGSSIPKFQHSYEVDKILFYNVFNRFEKYTFIKKVLKKLNLLNFAKKIRGKFYD
jgi:hypothetical protein